MQAKRSQLPLETSEESRAAGGWDLALYSLTGVLGAALTIRYFLS